mgnify:CR=1 FL=1
MRLYPSYSESVPIRALQSMGEIVAMARAKGTRVLFVVPAISLIDQTVDSFRRDGIESVGVIQADHWMTDASKPVQVCSIQTLERRALPEGVGLVIVDECHRGSKFLREWMAKWPTVPFIGLSATPWAAGMALQGYVEVRASAVVEAGQDQDGGGEPGQVHQRRVARIDDDRVQFRPVRRAVLNGTHPFAKLRIVVEARIR